MPGRASYDFVLSSEDFQGRPLDPEDEEDQQEIIIAAQLSRIVCRKLEIEGYKALQAEINGMRTSNSTSNHDSARLRNRQDPPISSLADLMMESAVILLLHTEDQSWKLQQPSKFGW
jgi:hypothetical protein